MVILNVSMKKNINIKPLLYCIISLSFHILQAQNNFLCLDKISSNEPEKARVSLNKLLEKTRNSINECDNSSCRARVYHAMGSIYYFLSYSSDTVQYYLDKAYEEDSLWLCRQSKKLDLAYREHPTAIYYASRFSKDWWLLLRKKCNNICEECEINNSTSRLEIDSSKNIDYQKQLIEIGLNDQKFRALGKMYEQSLLDSLNRFKLDSLYKVFGFPTKSLVSDVCQEKVWLVIHHSTDCDWTKKWIDMLLTAYQNKASGVFFLSQTISRFFAPETGYCKLGRKEFIDYLKRKYPKDYGKKFGYDNLDKE